MKGLTKAGLHLHEVFNYCKLLKNVVRKLLEDGI